MTRRSSSQWDFGELFSPQQVRRVLTVGELTAQVKRLLEQQVGLIWVTGEITNLRAQSSGHIYFTLKDVASQLACVLFRGETVAHRSQLQDGQKVILQGQVTVYEARGQYQLIVRAVELQGVGALQLAFERLKQKLAGEGLFAADRKRTLPVYPRCIGVVTSPTGAALQDVLHVVRRRDPGLRIVLAPCRVQGEGAAREIAEAIGQLNICAATRPGGPEAILVTRGGGSLEDLWAFNEEIVARAIAASVLPVISGVGHEIDFTISDFVADVRAATPSAAAEILTQGVLACRTFVFEAPGRMAARARRSWRDAVEARDHVVDRLHRVHPRRRLQEQMQRLDDAQEDLGRRFQDRWREILARAGDLAGRLRRLRLREEVGRRRELMVPLTARLDQAKTRWFEGSRYPEQVLARGYSITTDAETGRVLRDAAEVPPGTKLRTRLQKGAVTSRAEPIETMGSRLNS